jgi:hypothetical protein
MGFRFRRRLKIFPGLWVNLSKRGGSLSVGGRGATINVSKKGVRETVGLPGTGISYQAKTVRPGRRRTRKASQQHTTSANFLLFIAITVIILWILAHAH